MNTITVFFEKIIAFFTGIFTLIASFFGFATTQQSVAPDYYLNIKSDYAIEQHYMNKGEYDVSYIEYDTDDKVVVKYEIWYPTELESANKKYPMVVMMNGSGVLASLYKAIFDHLASWGFIVIGNEDPSTGTGISADKMLSFMYGENDNPDSIFYNKIDIENIGVTGHSQGGAGVFSALSITENCSIFKTGVAISPAHEESSTALGWAYELDKISVPVMMVSGNVGKFENEIVIPFDKMQNMYAKIKSDKLMAVRDGCDHDQMLYMADGYMTAWLMWHLQGDSYAAGAFTGDDAEIFNNTSWKDVKRKFS